jgi:hypothetical protein
MIFAIIILANISLGDGNEDLSGSVSISGPSILKVGETGTFIAEKDDNVSFAGGWPGSGNTRTKTIKKNTPSLTKDNITCTVGNGNSTYTAKHTCYWVDPKIKKVEFVSDHGTLKNYTANFSGDGENLYPIRGWDSDNGDHPISHDMNKKARVKLTIDNISADVQYDVDVSGNLGSTTFINRENIKGKNPVFETSSSSIANSIGILQDSIKWKIYNLTFDSDSVNVSDEITINQKTFVTWSYPAGSSPTYKRLNWACENADNATSKESICDKISTKIAALDKFGNTSDKGWGILDPGSKGDCDDLARCMKKAIQILGVHLATLREIKAAKHDSSPDYICGIVPHYIHQNGDEDWLIFDFDTGAGRNWNAYEGTCYVSSENYYYAIEPYLKKNTPIKIVQGLPAEQWWVRTKNNVEPGVGDWKVIEIIRIEQKP